MSARTIERVTAWLVHLPYNEGPYRMSGDRISTGMDALPLFTRTHPTPQTVLNWWAKAHLSLQYSILY